MTTVDEAGLLIADIEAEMSGRQRGYADTRGELLFRCLDALAAERARGDRAVKTAARLLNARRCECDDCGPLSEGDAEEYEAARSDWVDLTDAGSE